MEENAILKPCALGVSLILHKHTPGGGAGRNKFLTVVTDSPS